ncbi:MAG: HD domain-containing phosphohydrolase, partial [Candidatus Competibacterales bacterium]|nr:HD domain-containing phosphohydrolase [Candidatus Competibacterales bacterium]
VAVSLLGLYSRDHISELLIERGREALIEHDRTYLREKLIDLGVILTHHLDLAEQSLRLQALEVERALAAPTPREAPVTLTEDFAAGRVATRHVDPYHRPAPERVPLSISLAHGAFALAPGVTETPAIRADRARLASVEPRYRALHEESTLDSLWHYTALESGLLHLFPGHAEVPADYDPRTRLWYRAARAADELILTDVMVDMATGVPILTLAMPVHGPDGSVVGVTALDMAQRTLLSRHAHNHHAPHDWMSEARLFLLATEPGTERLRIMAGSDDSDHEQPPQATAPLPVIGPVEYQAVTALVPGEVGLYGFDDSVSGNPQLLGITPLPEVGRYLALSYPLSTTAIDTVAREFAELRDRNTRWLSVLALVIALAAIGLAIIGARRFTGPIQRIIEATGHIARGEPHRQLELNRRDELGELACSIDSMAHHLTTLRHEQDQALLRMVRSLTRALEQKDSYTATHSRRVSHYAVKLGRRLQLSERSLRDLRFGALIHDLGKIGVPDRVLGKPGRLTVEEQRLMHSHPAHAARILAPLRQRAPAAVEIAVHHHERWDGSGYPEGLRGGQIPLLARIVAIADAWESMTSDRVYRPAMTSERALSILECEYNSGQWDPELMREFIGLIREELAAIREKRHTATRSA